MHGLALQEGRLLGEVGEPTAAAHHVEAALCVDLALAGEGDGREVVVGGSLEHGAASAACEPACACFALVADACEGPHVVHGPHHALAAVHDAAQVGEREHGLVGPVQVYDVGLAEGGVAGDVVAEACRVDAPQPLAAEAVAEHDFGSFEGELGLAPQCGLEGQHAAFLGLGLCVAAQHAGLHTPLVEGAQQAQGRNGRTACVAGGVHQQHLERALRGGGHACL